MNKFLTSKGHIPKNLVLYLSAFNPSISSGSSHVFLRTHSSIPKAKPSKENKQDQSADRLDKTDQVKFFMNMWKDAVKANTILDGKKKYAAEKINISTKIKTDGNILLSTADSRSVRKYADQEIDFNSLPGIYGSLSKARLTSLVVATATVGYVMTPASITVFPLLCCAAGTALSSAAANTINQILEVPYDSQMSRTKTRPLVTGLITPLNATTYAAVCSALGLSILWFGVNPLVCGLGAFNIILYAFIYTPLKRVGILNTWVGSIVGAIPPLMGWAACTGSLEPSAFLLSAILFVWQFPHFNALSWNYKPDYSRAGYKMTCICNPALCRRVALRYSLAMIPLSAVSSYIELTHWLFTLESLPVNMYLVYLSYNFYNKGDSKSSRSLFRYSLIHLPLLMVLMILNKRSEEDIKKDQVL